MDKKFNVGYVTFVGGNFVYGEVRNESETIEVLQVVLW